jgi:hypothetical protein
MEIAIMAKLDQEALAQVVTAVVQALQVQGASPKAAAKPSNGLEARDRSIIAGFKRRGIADVVLMDRADKSKPYNVRPYRDWLTAGWQVRKGEKSIRGLFHQSQCDRIAPKAPAKGKFGKAKAQPMLV